MILSTLYEFNSFIFDTVILIINKKNLLDMISLLFSTNFVSVSVFIVFIIFPPLPIIRPIKLLCARTFKTISLEKKKI